MAINTSRLRTAPDDLAAVHSPAASPRRSYPIVAAGLLAALVGALLFATIAAGFDHRRAVLVVNRPVVPGNVLTADDLRTAKITPGDGIGFIAAEDKPSVVGRSAAVALVAGSLLLPAQLGSPAGPAEGQAVVGLLLEPGRFPPGLRPGDQVAVVSAPTGPVAASDEPARLGIGVVEEVAEAPAAGGVTTRVRLGTEASDRVAAEGASRRVALVLLHNGGAK